MSKIRHTLQLLYSGNLSQRQIGAALGISKSTVSEIASYTRAAGLDWEQAQHLSVEALQARLYRPPVARQSRHLEPDYAHLHGELKRAGITLQLLWEEYQQQHQGVAYKYSAFCEKYQQWAKRLKRSMRQTHEAGDKLFVAVLGATRHAVLPHVPTFAELGLSGFEDIPYYGFFAPVVTPKAAIDKFSDALAKVLTLPEVREQLTAMGLSVGFMSQQQLASRERA